MLVYSTLCDDHGVDFGGWEGGWLNRLEIDDGAVADHGEYDECYRQSIYDEECVVV